MNKIQRVFGRPRVLLPVIHACSLEQVHEQADIAREGGADGVFLINQGGLTEREVVSAAGELMDVFPKFFVGVNLLGCTPTEVFALLPERIGGLWSDGLFMPSTRFRGLYFGGVAFKGQRQVDPADYAAAAKHAIQVGADVVTTSGPRTGSPPLPAKLAAMREAIGDHPLALASGVTPENVGDFLPHVDAFLVASGIEQEFGQFNRARLRQLAETVHNYESEIRQ